MANYVTRIVSSGVVSNGLVLDKGSAVYVSSGGLVDSVIVSSGASAGIASGGSAVAIKEEGGMVSWDNGAVVSFVPSVFSNYVYSGIGSGGHGTIHSGTTAVSTTLTNSAYLRIYNGGLATDTNLKIYGSLHVYFGGETRDTVLNPSTECNVYSGAVVSNIIVSAGASMGIASGGSAVAIKEEGGMVSWENGAVVSFVPSVFSNYVYSGIGSAGHATIHSGTTAVSATLTNSAYLRIYNGGLVTDTNLKTNTGLHVYSGGEARDTIVNSKAHLCIYSGGWADSFIVSSGASVIVSSGGMLTGQLEIKNGAVVSASAGAIIDFDISNFEPGNAVRVSNLSLVKGAPVYTLTVSGTQAYGVYSLADSAAGFDRTIYVLYPFGEIIGTLTVENPLVTYDTAYVAAIGTPAGGSVLSLTVAQNEAPTVTDIKADITMPTYRPVTVTAVFSDDYGVASALYKIGDSGAWTAYVDGVTVRNNSTIYFKAIDIGGKESEVVSYEVTNIAPAPNLEFFWPYEWSSWAVIAQDSDQATEQTPSDYRQLYLSYSVDNEGAADSNPFSVETYIDGDYYRTESFQGVKSLYYRQLDYQKIGSFAAGEHTVTLKIIPDENDAVSEDNVYSRTFTVEEDGRGEFYKGYYGGSSRQLDFEATLSLDCGKYVISGDFIGLETGKRVNAKIEIYNSTGKKVGTVSVKKGKVAYKEFILSNDTYTVYVRSADKQKTADRISFGITGDVFYKADQDDNRISSVSGCYPYIATVRDTARSLVSNGWVGFGDVLSFRQVDFEYSGKYTFTVKSSDQVKVSLISVTVDGKGRSKEKNVASTSIGGKKIGKEIGFGGVLLTSGTYYLKVEALKAAKGTNADYSVRINGNSTFFTDGDDGWNNYLYDKKAAHPLNPNADDFITTEITSDTNEILLDDDCTKGDWSNFVGFGDDTDYARIVLSGDAKLSFNLTATDATKFTVYKLIDGTGKKAGTFTLKSLQATTLKKVKGTDVYSAGTKVLALDEGEYFISMQSTNAKKGGSAYYNVELNKALSSGLPDTGIASPMSGADDAFLAPASDKFSGEYAGGWLASL